MLTVVNTEVNNFWKKSQKHSTRKGFEPSRAKPNGLAVHRLNHSATSSYFNSHLSSNRLDSNLRFETLFLVNNLQLINWDFNQRLLFKSKKNISIACWFFLQLVKLKNN